MAEFAELVISAKTDQLKRAKGDLNETTMAAGRTDRAVDKTGKAFVKTGAQAKTSTAGIAAGMKKAQVAAVALATAALGVGVAIKVIAEFETSISKLGAISGATTKQLAQMRDVAKELGSATEFSAGQAADGLTFLAQAGFTAQESIAAIPAVLDLATASGLGLAAAADTASNIMSGFAIAAGDAARVSDVLAAAAANSNTNVAQLGGAMSTVAPIAAALGIELEDTAASIGILSDAGIQGERAGTALRGVLAALAGPTSTATTVLKEMGLTIQDVDPATNSLADVLGKLQGAGLSTADAMTIFGREAASGALVLVKGAQQVDTFTEKLQGADGAAADMADTMRDNLGGDIKALQSSLSGLILAFGEAGLTSVLRGAIQAMTGLARLMSENVVPAFNALGVALAGIIATQIPALIVGLSLATAGMTAAGIATAVFTTAANAARIAMIALGGPIGIIFGLLGSAAAAWVLFGEKTDTSKTSTEEARIALSLLNEVLDGFSQIESPAAQGAALGNAMAYKEQAKAALAVARAEVIKIAAMNQTAEKRLSDNGGVMTFGTNLGKTRLSDAEEIVASLNAALTEADTRIKAVSTTISNQMIPPIVKATKVTKPLTSGLSGTGKAAGDAAKELEAMGDEIERLNFDADPVAKYNSEMQRLDELLQGDGTNKLTEGAYQKAVADLNEEFANSSPNITKIGDAIGDFVAGGMRDFGSLLDSFKNMLKQMISTAISNPIKLALTGASSGFGSTANAAGGGGGGGMGSMATVAGGLGAAMTAGGSLVGVSGLAGGFGAGVGMAASSLAGGGVSALGGTIAAQAGAATAAGASMASIGAALGTVALPLLALIVVFKALKGKTTNLDSGIRLTISSTDALAESFDKIEKSKFFGASEKQIETFKNLGEAADPLTNAIKEIQDNIIATAGELGVASDAFDGFSLSLKASTKGMSEDEAAATAAMLIAQITDTFAAMTPDLIAVGLGGEGAANSLRGLVLSLNTVNAVFDELGGPQFERTILSANHVKVTLENIFGTIDNFVTASAQYYQTFFTDTERAVNSTEQLTAVLSDLGLELPQSIAGFRALVDEAQNIGDLDTAATLIAISSAFDTLTTQLDNLNDNLGSALNGFASGISAQKSVIEKAVDALVKPLENAINRTKVQAENSFKIFKVAADKTASSAKTIVDIIRGTLDSRTIQSEIVELQRYQRAQRQIASFANGASFDETSLTRATDNVSINSEKFFGSFEDYARDFYKTQISLTKLAEKAKGELSDVEVQIAIAEKAYEIAQGTYQEAQDFNVALDKLLIDLASFTETSARNQPFIDQIKAEGERQVTLLDDILVETTKQVNGLLGIESSVADLAGSNVSVAEALGILGIEENEMSGAVIALKAPVAEIGSHIAALDFTLAGAYDSLGITIGELVNLDLAVGLEELDFFAPLAKLNLAEAFEGLDLSKSFMDLNLADAFSVIDLAAGFAEIDLASDFDKVDLAEPFDGLNLTGDLQTKISLLGGNVVAFSSAITLATGGLGINVTNLGTTINSSMVGLGSFLNSLTASINALAIARAAVPTPVINLYTDVLDRTPDELGLAYWRSTGLTGQALEDAFRQGAVNSGEVGSLGDLDEITGFANGGMHSGGLRLVGENGPELEVTGPSRVYSNENTKNMLSGNSQELIQELRNLREEVTNLRNQNRDIGAQSVKYGKKLYDLNREWDIVGLPPIRTA